MNSLERESEEKSRGVKKKLGWVLAYGLGICHGPLNYWEISVWVHSDFGSVTPRFCLLLLVHWVYYGYLWVEKLKRKDGTQVHIPINLIDNGYVRTGCDAQGGLFVYAILGLG
jgi:hypothetical protein